MWKYFHKNFNETEAMNFYPSESFHIYGNSYLIAGYIAISLFV